jgi:outer membrane protein TolC
MSGLKQEPTMKTKKVITVFLLMSLVLQSSAQETTTTLSLKQSCQLGIENNLTILNAALEQQKTNYKLKEAQSKLYPQIEGYSNFNYYYSIPKMVLPGEIFGQTGMIAVQIGTKYDWSNGFRASQVLYNQSYFTSLKLSRRLENMNGLTLQQKKEELVYQISQVYYLCMTTGKQIAQLNITMHNTEKLLEIAKLQQENGLILKVDYSRVMVNKTNLQTQIDNLNQLYQQQLGMLKYLIGKEQNSKVELSDSLSVSSIETSRTLPDFSNRTELQMLDKQMEVTSLIRTMNKQAYLPTLSGFGQYYFQGQRDQFDFFRGGDDKFFKVGVIGLSLSIPVFDGFEKHSKIRQGDIELEQLRNTRKNTSEYFSKEFADAVRQYDNNVNIVMRQQENIKSAEESYSVTLQGYRQQVASLSDLLMSESSLTEARLSYYNALLQLKNAGLEVRKSKGELLNY